MDRFLYAGTLKATFLGCCAWGSNRGPFDPLEKPTIDSRNESIVATNLFLIDRVDLKRSWRSFVLAITL